MSHILRCVWLVPCLVGLLATRVSALNPTFSLEATAVNSIPLTAGPVSEVSALPGDTLTAVIRARDWSPDGERLRAYQASLDAYSFRSGQAGVIMPVDFDETSEKQIENNKNAFIDNQHPQYIFTGLNGIELIDSISPGYRYLGILLNESETRLSSQDGTRYYCGTIHLRVSDNAQGLFVIRLDDDPEASTFQTSQDRAIIPLDLEPLTVHVKPQILRVVSSNPPNGAIDARCATGPPIASGDRRSGWDRVELTVSGDPAGLTKADFVVEDGTAKPPHIQRITVSGSVVTLTLDHGIRTGAWTNILHKNSQTGTRIAYLPGDVNNDGVINTSDMLFWIHQSEGDNSIPSYRADIDGDGTAGVGDILRIIDLLTEPDVHRAKLNK